MKMHSSSTRTGMVANLTIWRCMWYQLQIELLRKFCLFKDLLWAVHLLSHGLVYFIVTFSSYKRRLQWPQSSWSTSVQVMACRLYGTKPLTNLFIPHEYILINCQWILQVLIMKYTWNAVDKISAILLLYQRIDGGLIDSLAPARS